MEVNNIKPELLRLEVRRLENKLRLLQIEMEETDKINEEMKKQNKILEAELSEAQSILEEAEEVLTIPHLKFKTSEFLFRNRYHI